MYEMAAYKNDGTEERIPFDNFSAAYGFAQDYLKQNRDNLSELNVIERDGECMKIWELIPWQFEDFIHWGYLNKGPDGYTIKPDVLPFIDLDMLKTDARENGARFISTADNIMISTSTPLEESGLLYIDEWIAAVFDYEPYRIAQE
jgi:hypothetical protein